GKSGRLYGVTKGGGSDGRGTVFTLKPDGSDYKTIFNMNFNDGRYAVSPLVETTQDHFYGITHQGGMYDSGVLFHVDVRMYPQWFPVNARFQNDGVLGASVPDLNTATVVKTDGHVFPINPLTKQEGTIYPDTGVVVTSACRRDPHVVQFVYS